jgi:hypothetical protein
MTLALRLDEPIEARGDALMTIALKVFGKYMTWLPFAGEDRMLETLFLDGLERSFRVGNEIRTSQR